jgi:hypothetical protein
MIILRKKIKRLGISYDRITTDELFFQKAVQPLEIG